MGLEEAVEERDILKSQRQGNLLNLECGQFQLGFSIGQQGFVDDLSGRLTTHGFDGAAQVR